MYYSLTYDLFVKQAKVLNLSHERDRDFIRIHAYKVNCELVQALDHNFTLNLERTLVLDINLNLTLVIALVLIRTIILEIHSLLSTSLSCDLDRALNCACAHAFALFPRMASHLSQIQNELPTQNCLKEI